MHENFVFQYDCLWLGPSPLFFPEYHTKVQSRCQVLRKSYVVSSNLIVLRTQAQKAIFLTHSILKFILYIRAKFEKLLIVLCFTDITYKNNYTMTCASNLCLFPLPVVVIVWLNKYSTYAKVHSSRARGSTAISPPI